MPETDLPARLRIQSAAERLFAAHGFSGVSLRAIAADAKVPVGSIAYHFVSKEGLYRSIWDKWMGEADVARFLGETPLPETLTREEGLRRVIDAFFAGPRMILNRDDGHFFIAILVREAQDPNQASRGLMENFVEPSAQRIHADLASLVPELSEECFIVGFQMTISALRIVIEPDRSPHSFKMGKPPPPDRLFSIMRDFVVNGWLGLLTAS